MSRLDGYACYFSDTYFVSKLPYFPPDKSALYISPP